MRSHGSAAEVVVKALGTLGVDVNAKEEAGTLRVDDWYSATLTPEHSTSEDEAIDDKYHKYGSVKIPDLSLGFSQSLKGRQLLSKWSSEQQLGVLSIAESFSMLLRFNEEKTFLEWFENRNIPLQRKFKRINLWGFGRGLHSEQFYKRLENVTDGVIEVRVMEREDQIKNLVRVTSLKGQPHDTLWHEIEIKGNGEAVLTN